MLGHWSEAEDLVEQLADLVDHPTQQGELGFLWGVVLIRQGRLDEASPLIEETRDRLRRRMWSESVASMAAAVAMFDAANGRLDEAESLVNDVVADERPCFVGNSFLIATAIAWLGDRLGIRPDGLGGPDQQALATAERWIHWMRAVEHDTLRSSRVEQLYGDLALAEFTRLQGQSDAAKWEQLAAAWQRLGVRYEEAYARFRHVEALLAGTPARVAGRRRAANDILTVASTIAQELDAVPLLTQIQQLARRARLTLTPASSPHSEHDHDRLGDDLGLTSQSVKCSPSSPRLLQRPDRQRAVHQHQDRQRPRLQPHPQAPGHQPHRGCSVRRTSSTPLSTTAHPGPARPISRGHNHALDDDRPGRDRPESDGRNARLLCSTPSTQPASEGTGRPLAETQVDNGTIDDPRNDETAAQ